MHPQEAEDWKEEVLGEIFRSLAGHPPLRSMLVFKGARVLNERLHELGRRSLDIDSNLVQSFVDAVPEPALRQERLERELRTAMSRHFDAQSPVRYSVERIRIEPQPPADHPRGWDGYDVKISVSDLARRGVRGLPSLTLDVAAPEQLREDSIAPLTIGAATVLAYTLERIAGEKLRAFLSSLPDYRAKMNRRGKSSGPRTYSILPELPVYDRWPIGSSGCGQVTNSGWLASHASLIAAESNRSSRIWPPPSRRTETMRPFRTNPGFMRRGPQSVKSWHSSRRTGLSPSSVRSIDGSLPAPAGTRTSSPVPAWPERPRRVDIAEPSFAG